VIGSGGERGKCSYRGWEGRNIPNVGADKQETETKGKGAVHRFPERGGEGGIPICWKDKWGGGKKKRKRVISERPILKTNNQLSIGKKKKRKKCI